MTEDEMVGWHHQHNGLEFEQATGNGEGQGSPACCSPWGPKELAEQQQQSSWALTAMKRPLRERQREFWLQTEGEETVWSQRKRLQWCSHKPRNPRATGSWKRPGMGFPLEILKAAQPCWHLDSSQLIKIWNFRAPKLWENTFLLFQPLGLL